MKPRIATVITTFGLAAGLAAAPFAALDGNSLFDGKPAFANQGNGNGGGNGNAGGNGNGNGHDVGHDMGQGKGHAMGQGKGHAKGHGLETDKSKKSGHVSVGSKVKGAFNAVHASPTAMAHASPTSQVGKVKSYLDAISADEVDVEAAAEAAVTAAKGKAIDFGVLDGVHSIAGVEVDDAATQEIADIAADIQAGALDGDDGDDGEGDGGEEGGDLGAMEGDENVDG